VGAEFIGIMLAYSYLFAPGLRPLDMDQTTLRGLTAVIHGGSGAIGSAVAGVFAREGARLFVTGRTTERLERVVGEVQKAGGAIEAERLDVLCEQQVEAHAAKVAARAGSLDILVNAVGADHVQGPSLFDLSLADFAYPIDFYLRANFIVARAAARHMVAQKSGVLLTFSPPGSRLVGRGWLGSGAAFAGVEALSRLLAAELGPSGVRCVCLQPDAIPEALAHGSHTNSVFGRVAEAQGSSVQQLMQGRARQATLLGRLPSLSDVAEAAAFLASPRAKAMTGAIANLTCGSLTD
jgi:NAD(P)-dependent dehydrogenase (short-subunit alcohol dehydrogenase family)